MARCKNCKCKFEPKYFLQKFCIENDECIRAFAEFAKLQAEKNNKKEIKDKKIKLKEESLTLSDYLKLAQKIFNQYINLRDKGLPCISCDCEVKAPNASHFFSVGSTPSLRFNEDNVHTSCIRCNLYLHGNINQYAIRLPKKIGKERYELLLSLRNTTRKYTIKELKDLIAEYRKKIKEIKKKY